MSNYYLLTVGVINKILFREFLFLTVENHIVTYLRKWAKVDNLEKFLWPATQLPVVMKFTLRNKFCGAHMMARKVVPPEIFRLDPWWHSGTPSSKKSQTTFSCPPSSTFTHFHFRQTAWREIENFLTQEPFEFRRNGSQPCLRWGDQRQMFESDFPAYFVATFSEG